MIIALDYDKTYTADSDLWDMFIAMAQSRGHQVICITMRYPNKAEQIDRTNFKVNALYYTSRKAKLRWINEFNVKVDIWIDDKPGYLFDNAVDSL